jgi:hypothetical protein
MFRLKSLVRKCGFGRVSLRVPKTKHALVTQILLEATEEEKLKIRENQKFMLLMFGGLILVVAILFGAVYLSQ